MTEGNQQGLQIITFRRTLKLHLSRPVNGMIGKTTNDNAVREPKTLLSMAREITPFSDIIRSTFAVTKKKMSNILQQEMGALLR